jgi:hypothetical protein
MIACHEPSWHVTAYEFLVKAGEKQGTEHTFSQKGDMLDNRKEQNYLKAGYSDIRATGRQQVYEASFHIRWMV